MEEVVEVVVVEEDVDDDEEVGVDEELELGVDEGVEPGVLFESVGAPGVPDGVSLPWLPSWGLVGLSALSRRSRRPKWKCCKKAASTTQSAARSSSTKREEYIFGEVGLKTTRKS